MNPLTQFKNTTIPPVLIALTLACFAFSPQARAVCREGCLTNQNTVLGEDALFNNSGGFDNTAIGFQALLNNIGGVNNTATGFQALFYNTSGNFNTANGMYALNNNDANSNTATGFDALFSNTEGTENTANGANALQSNATGSHNTATGAFALGNNTIGLNNTATGSFALSNNTTGNDNTANGVSALLNNTTGNFNTAVGGGALTLNNADSNTAVGAAALLLNTSGTQNTAVGTDALVFNDSGTSDTGIGYFALESNTTGGSNTAIGFNALSNNTTGNSNIALGESAGSALTTGRNNIDIGNAGVAGESAKIRIGNAAHRNTFIRGISGVTVPGGVGVIIATDGHLGTSTSSARYKDNIQSMDKASEAILALKPVTFRFKKELDPEGIPQFGLVAEDVEKVSPDLVARDADGKPYTVRYEAVNAMLLNEFLKEHRKVEQQEATITQLKSALAKQETVDAEQQKQIEALTTGLQKVSAQIELSKPALQTVLNNQ